MAKIVSRTDTDAGRLAALQQLIMDHSLGNIGKAEDNPNFVVADNFEDGLDQVNQLFMGLKAALVAMRTRYDVLDAAFVMTRTRLELVEDLLASVVEDIDYDEPLDHATMDLMDCMASRGSCGFDADGHLVFDERSRFSKEDIKPMLREAIVRWVELRMSK